MNNQNADSDNRPRQAYVELVLDVPRQLTDAVCNFIIDNICSGLVLEDEDDSPLTRIMFYVPEGDEGTGRDKLDGYLHALGEEVLPEIPPITFRSVQQTEWEEQYRQSVRPVRISSEVIIRPPWDISPEKVRYDIIIEPKMAFGTGRHETTSSCLKIILEHLTPGMRFLDIGCGSGILSILADKIGVAYIKAVDTDMLAVDNCLENFAVNEVAAEHSVIHGSIEKTEGDEPYEFVCANIIKSTILEMLPRLKAITAEGGILVLSGLLADDAEEVAAGLKALGLENYTTVQENEWLTHIVHKG